MPFHSEDTIAAISTPMGRGGLGVIRLSGPLALAVTDSLFFSPDKQPLSTMTTHTLRYGWIKDGDGNTVDEVIVSLMRSPRSYTGEDVVEISAHGGPVVLKRILALCLARGARPARPGEFTFRAFLSGRIDLARAEAVADLIASRTEQAAQAAAEQLKGVLSKRVLAWRSLLIDLVAALEVALDYGEEDIVFLTPDEIAERLTLLRYEMAKILETAARGKLLREGAKTAIIGKPNAGKSSLLNALLEKDRAIVTDIPGTTRDIIEETLDCQGIPVVIIDTAGLRQHTLDPVEKLGQEKTVACIRSSDVVLWLLDAGEPISETDRYIGDLLHSMDACRKTIVVLNKIDRGEHAGPELEKVASSLPQVRVSALKRQGLQELEQAILSLLDSSPKEEPLVTNVRHQDALVRSGKAIDEALQAVERKEPEEFIALHLREALSALGEITGETATEEILATIFSKFCVGK